MRAVFGTPADGDDALRLQTDGLDGLLNAGDGVFVGVGVGGNEDVVDVNVVDGGVGRPQFEIGGHLVGAASAAPAEAARAARRWWTVIGHGNGLLHGAHRQG